MSAIPDIRIVKSEFGYLAVAPALNPKLSADSALLIVTLDVRWDECQPAETLRTVEDDLMHFLPSFGRHECRGEEAYHAFARKQCRTPSAAAAEPVGEKQRTNGNYFEGALALVHLIEHATLDFLCTITRVTRCSGFTGAYREPPERFDLIVECRDYRAGRCALLLALSWITAAVEGYPPRGPEREVLQVARLAYADAGRGLTTPSVARDLHWDEPRATRALASLKDVGYLDESRYSLNFSGVTEYRAPGD